MFQGQAGWGNQEQPGLVGFDPIAGGQNQMVFTVLSNLNPSVCLWIN